MLPFSETKVCTGVKSSGLLKVFAHGLVDLLVDVLAFHNVANRWRVLKYLICLVQN